MVDPVFIFSLPRSGSTLLQRILTSHEKISSFAEPHFLLPIIGMLKSEGTLTNSSHQSTHKGVMDVVDHLPHGEKDFYEFVNAFSKNIYNSLSDKGAKYFIDKTPRYVFIIEEIAEIFPKAKFIFLFRSPIQILASIIATFSSGRFHKMYGFNNILFNGFDTLSKEYAALKDRSISVRYEDLLLNPEENLKMIYDYLDIEYDMSVLQNFSSVDLIGKSVDPTGTIEYTKLSLKPLTKWKETFNSKYRNKILTKYVESLNNKSLEIQGYKKDELLEEIHSNNKDLQNSKIVDFIDIHKSRLVRYLNLNLYFDKKLSWVKGQYLN